MWHFPWRPDQVSYRKWLCYVAWPKCYGPALSLTGWPWANPFTCLSPGPPLLWKERWVWGCALVDGTQTFFYPLSSPGWPWNSQSFPYILSYNLLPVPIPSSGPFQPSFQPQIPSFLFPMKPGFHQQLQRTKKSKWAQLWLFPLEPENPGSIWLVRNNITYLINLLIYLIRS